MSLDGEHGHANGSVIGYLLIVTVDMSQKNLSEYVTCVYNNSILRQMLGKLNVGYFKIARFYNQMLRGVKDYRII
jgi:hypothetical protein